MLEEELRRVRLGPLHRPKVTLRELTEAYVAQYEAAPSTVAWLRDNMRPALERFGDEPIGSLTVDRDRDVAGVAAGGQALPLASGAAAGAAGGGAVAVDRGQPRGAGEESRAASRVRSIRSIRGTRSMRSPASWTRSSAPLVVFLAGTGVRPEEAFGAEWRDVDLERRMFMVRRAFAKGRLKEYGKTTGSRRAVPLRARVVASLELLQNRRGIVFPAPGGGRIEINNWRSRVVDAGPRGGRRQAQADLRPAPHVRNVEPRRGRGHLHAGPSDGHERQDDRPHLRPPGGRRGCVRTRAARRVRSGAARSRWTRCGRGGGATMRLKSAPRTAKALRLQGSRGSGSDGTRTRDLRRDRPAL